MKSENHEEYLDYYRNYREKNRIKLRRYSRLYNQLWRKKNGYHNELNSKKRYPEKQLARRMSQYALKVGKIKKLPCKNCNNKWSEMHHPDYYKPLEIVWLCRLCHTKEHKKINSKESIR